MTPNEFLIELPRAIVSKESLDAAEPLLAFASERLGELEAQRDALALSILFDNNPILGSFEFKRRADRSVQLGGESPDGEPLFIPSECRSPLSEPSASESYAESDLEGWIASLSERSLARLKTGCFYQDPSLPIEQALIKQALGTAALERILAGQAPVGAPRPSPAAGETEALSAPIRLELDSPDSPLLLIPAQAALIKALQERLDALETQRAVFELADLLEQRPELDGIRLPKTWGANSDRARKPLGLAEEIADAWVDRLPEADRARLGRSSISRPEPGDLVSGLMQQCLAPAEFARWQGAALAALAGSLEPRAARSALRV